MSHNLTLRSPTEEFPLLQTPTELTRSMEGKTSSAIREAYLEWARDEVYETDLVSEGYWSVHAANEYYEHANKLLTWLLDNPNHTWGST